MTCTRRIRMSVKNIKYIICLVIAVLCINIWYTFSNDNHPTRKYQTHISFVSKNRKHFQSTYSSEGDPVLLEGDSKSQQTVIVTDLPRTSRPIIAKELTETRPINRAELTKSPPINRVELTKSPPIDRDELTKSHRINSPKLTKLFRVNQAELTKPPPINRAQLTKSPPINRAELTKSPPIRRTTKSHRMNRPKLTKLFRINRPKLTKLLRVNRTELTKPHSMTAGELTRKHISANGSYVRPHTCNNCFRHDFVYLIQNEDICSETKQDEVDLIIIILTTHENIYRRNVIRETWASISRNNTGNVRYVFLLGEVPSYELMENVKLEAWHYEDMLMENFRDSYSNLTYKTIMGLKWVSSFCDNAKFVLKTDDDMWVNVPQILRMVSRNQLFLQSGVSGMCGEGLVMRDEMSKGYITYNEYPLSYYPGYCSGSGYVTSMVVGKRIYNISRHVPFLKFEDAYIGLCIEALGNVHVRSEDGFFYMGNFKGDPCFYKSSLVLTCHIVPVPFFKYIFQAEC